MAPFSTLRCSICNQLSYIWPTRQPSLVTRESSERKIHSNVSSIGPVSQWTCTVQSEITKRLPQCEQPSNTNVSFSCIHEVAHIIYCNWYPWPTIASQVSRLTFCYYYWLVLYTDSHHYDIKILRYHAAYVFLNNRAISYEILDIILSDDDR